MSRPATLKIGSTSYWTIMTYTDAGVLVDADSTPTVTVRKNGVANADIVTVVKRSATTGIYDAYYNPAGESEGDCFTLEETATISAQAYQNAWNLEILAVERGTDNASTFDSASDAVTTDAASRTASQADVSGLATSASISALNDFDPSSQAVANVTTVGTVTNAVSASVQSVAANAINAAAISSDAVTEIQTGLASATELATVPKIGTQYTHTAQSGDTIQVTIS